MSKMPSFRALTQRGAAWTGGHLSRATAHVWTLLSSKVQGTQSPHRGKRWQLSALPPKASPPPSPLLPSEIKYSASLVRGQAVVHAVLGVILFTFGVLGSHRWASSTCVPGLVCGVAGVAAGVCGGLAHKIWYKNWAIKSFLISSVVVVVLSLLAMALTFYFMLNSSSAYEAHTQYESFRLERLRSQVGEQEQDEIIGTFFEVPTPPPSKSLVGNMVVGLLLQLLVSMWCVLTAWRGVRAHEFTPRRREELLKQIMAAAPARKAQVDAEDMSSMPLAALYQLLQTHPELLQGAATRQEQSQRPASRHSMDYHERVCRYLSKAHEADPISTQGNRSPTPCDSSPTSLKQPSISAATETKMAAAQCKESIKHQSRQRLASPTLSTYCQIRKTSLSNASSSSSPVHFPKFRDSSDRTSATGERNEEPALEELPPRKVSPEVEKPSDVIKSSDFKDSSDVQKSCEINDSFDGEKSCEINESSEGKKSCEINESLEGKKSCEINESSEGKKSFEINKLSDVEISHEIKETAATENSDDDIITNETQPQLLVLGSKMLPPLSTHLIKPSDLVPKKVTQQMRRSSVGAKHSLRLQNDSENNVTRRNTLDRPPVTRKEYGKPKFVLNADVHRMLRRSEKQINGEPRQSRSISDLGDVKRNWNMNKLACKDRSYNGLKENEVKTQVNSSKEDQSLKTKVSSQSDLRNLSNSTKSRRASNAPQIQRKKKNRKPPPIPIVKDSLVQEPVNANVETSEEKLASEVNTLNNLNINDDKLLTTVDSDTGSSCLKRHIEHDGSFTEVAIERKLSFVETHPLQRTHDSEEITTRSVQSSDSGVSSVVGSDDNISSDGASPPASHVSINQENVVDKQDSDCDKSFRRDEVIKEDVTPVQKSAMIAELRPLKQENIDQECEREKDVTTEDVGHLENPGITHEINNFTSNVCDNKEEVFASASETTFQIENAEENLPEFNNLNSKVIDQETSHNTGGYCSPKSSIPYPIEPENKKVSHISSDSVADAEGSKTREVPFVKSVILKNNCAEEVQTNENRKQSPGLSTQSLQSLGNISRSDPGSTKSSKTKSLPVTGSNDVKISFRSLRDETSIPTSFGSIKNNKSFEQILAAILSKAHNLTTSKPTSVPGPKKSTTLPSSKVSENKSNTRDSHESQEQENKEKETAKGPSSSKPSKSLTIEIRPYESRNIREEINSLKN
ncbi:hypothetical protein FHG87_015392 [Trinorchestia longiramus]|nr:hypothetical protein FHG87_015392 [Trinorchestia longiramus]